MVKNILGNNQNIIIQESEIVNITGNNNEIANYGIITKLLGNNNNIINYGMINQSIGHNNDVINRNTFADNGPIYQPLTATYFEGRAKNYYCQGCRNWFDEVIAIGNPGGSFDNECPICGSWNFLTAYEYNKNYSTERRVDDMIWDGSVSYKDEDDTTVTEQTDIELENMQNKVKDLLKLSKKIKGITTLSIILSIILTVINLFSSSITFNIGVGFANFLILCRNLMYLTTFAGMLPLFLFVRVIKIPMSNKKITYYIVEKETKQTEEKRNCIAANALSDKSADLYIQLEEEINDIGNKGVKDLLFKCKEALTSAEKRYIKIKKVLTQSDQLETLKRVLVTMAQSLDDTYNATIKIINRAIIFEDDMSVDEQEKHRRNIENVLKNMFDVSQKMGELSDETLSYMEDKENNASTLAIEALIEALASLHTKIIENQ